MTLYRLAADGAHVFSSGDRHLVLTPNSSSVHQVLPESYAKVPSLRTISGILGTIQLKLNTYVVLITSHTITGSLLGHSIAKATSFEISPLGLLSALKDAEEERYLHLLQLQLDSSPLFYAIDNGYDLTRSFQSQLTSSSPSAHDGLEFWWNQYLTTGLKPEERLFCVKAIYGYFLLSSILAPDHRLFEFALLTRRSVYRAGTRYFRRGIDDEGHVANFNETEQFIIADKYANEGKSSTHVYLFLQIRGSVPVFWAQINNLKYLPNLRISLKSSAGATAKHYTELTDRYGDVVCVNLVDQKGYEKPVKEAFERAVEGLPAPLLQKVKYIYFDYHHECRGLRWDRIELLLKHLIELGYTSDEYFEYDLTNKKVLQTQKKIVRTNCMDCLDRTNVVQSTLGKWVIQNQLTKAGFLAESSLTPWNVSIPGLVNIFRNVWADNADAVSCSYSGTGALKTDYTRTGKRTKVGAFNDLVNSITRYYKNNYNDGNRQDLYDLILGQYKPFQESFNSPFVDRRPPYIQLLPYIMGTSLFVLFAIILFPRGSITDWKNLFVIGTTLAINARGAMYLKKEGYQFVNWPKLEHLDYIKKVDVFDGLGKLVGYRYEENDQFSTHDGKKKL